MKSTQPVVPYTTERQRQLVYGFLNPSQGRVWCAYSPGNLTAHRFIGVLKQLPSILPQKKIHVVLDNSRTYTAKCILKFESLNTSWLNLHFIPPYSPYLNPIERF